MREIKFRAWDKVCKKWLYFNVLERPNCDKCIIMELEHICQYTGLKDKNGKEIYEGDIVKTPAGVGSVYWDKCYLIIWKGEGDTGLYNTAPAYLEVIGNIYENPELLEATDGRF